MEQRRYGADRNGSRNQPASERKQRRFNAKTAEAADEYKKHQIFIKDCCIYYSAILKVLSLLTQQDEHERNEAEGRAAEHITEVLLCRPDRLVISKMNDKREGNQR